MPPLEPPAVPAAARYTPPANVRVVRGVLFQDGRSYTVGDELYYTGDLAALIALSQAEPGSLTEAQARKSSRDRAVVELIGQMSTEERKRQARLRRNPVEAPEALTPPNAYGSMRPGP